MSEHDAPVVAAYKPCLVSLKEGKRYFWCACGKSKNQPFCDGAHKGTPFEPLVFTADTGGDALLCACKRTKDAPYCDGSHNDIPGAYKEDDPQSAENRKILLVDHAVDPVTKLDGDCYVFRKSNAEMHRQGRARYTPVISPSQGALYQSQFYLELETGRAPVIGVDDRHAVIFVTAGSGRLLIGPRAFDYGENVGAYVRPGETLLVEANEPTQLFLSICPGADGLSFSQNPADAFDDAFPDRTVPVDVEKRQTMAARFFQMLVDKTIGSTVATQFIGHIPLSKAEPHRHLYEEALIILSGEGAMWTETKKTTVEAGDVIFLPAKQIHSLQSTSEDGMDVVGVIYPGDNPTINY